MMSVNLSTAGALPLRVGDVLLADDVGNTVWRVSPAAQP